jgi:hypothetical protein
MKDFIVDIGVPIAIILALFLMIFGPIGALIVWSQSAQCSAQGTKMGVPSSWGFIQDCMVQVDGRWIRMDAYRIVKVQP